VGRQGSRRTTGMRVAKSPDLKAGASSTGIVRSAVQTGTPQGSSGVPRRGWMMGLALLGLVRGQKLRTDPTLQAGVLDLDPIPLSACSCELRALGGSPNNGRVSGGARPDVDTRTLQKDEVRVLRRGGGLGRHGACSNLGRSLGCERSRHFGRRNHARRSRRTPNDHGNPKTQIEMGERVPQQKDRRSLGLLSSAWAESHPAAGQHRLAGVHRRLCCGYSRRERSASCRRVDRPQGYGHGRD